MKKIVRQCSEGSQIIAHEDGRWSLRCPNGHRANGTAPTQQEALEIASRERAAFILAQWEKGVPDRRLMFVVPLT